MIILNKGPDTPPPPNCLSHWLTYDMSLSFLGQVYSCTFLSFLSLLFLSYAVVHSCCSPFFLLQFFSGQEEDEVEPFLQMTAVIDDGIVVEIIMMILLYLLCILYFVWLTYIFFFRLSILSSTFLKLNVYFITVNDIYAFMCNCSFY